MRIKLSLMKATYKLTYLLSIIATLVLTAACADDDTFSVSPNNLLTFSCDTVKLDTIFSKVPSSTRTMWVYNNSGDGLRCSSIKLSNGNQTGFRVNVNGVYLGDAQGYQISNEEIRKGDSIRVFVEATTPVNNELTPQLVSDNLVFTLESGVQQKLNLQAWSWDAELLRDVVVSSDTVISSNKPVVVYGGITVNDGATLTIPAGQTLYMHSGAVIDVFGKLQCNGEPGNEVVLRGDRLDNMFDYLKYDEVSGQWGGIRLHSDSYDNVITHTDIHATGSAVLCDSADVSRQKLTLTASTIHNAKGYGIYARNCRTDIANTLISNTLYDCLSVVGGVTNVNNSTIAQFYPFDGRRGAALTIIQDTATVATTQEFCIRNSIVTGYANDVVMVANVDTAKTTPTLLFDHCLMRTPEVSDTLMCRDIIWEDVSDTTVAGWKNFANIDIVNLKYDFHLSPESLAIGKAASESSLPTDRDATRRDDQPDMGCYEAVKGEETEE